MTATHQKPYKGIGMEGPIATWYAKNTARDARRFQAARDAVVSRVPSGGSILEVAPGPGYLAIEIAKTGRRVTTLDISESFVRIAQENAARAGVSIDVRHGNASEMPFADGSFDYVVCMAAFKNFSNPIGALNEIHRVLKPLGQASIFDLRKDATHQDIDDEIRGMQVSAFDRLLTRYTFRLCLLKRAYTRDELERMAVISNFGQCEIAVRGIGFELRLRKV